MPAAGRHRTNAEWSRTSIASLRRHARREFASHGYAGASLDRIAARASATKGAIYHHFGSKESLFEAVFRDAEAEIVRRIEADAAAATDPVEGVIAGCLAFVRVALDDRLRQIVLVDGPVVLGWSRWRAIDTEFGLGSLTLGLQACHAAGRLRDVHLQLLAHLISGAVNEAVFLIAESVDRQRAFDDVAVALRRALRCLLIT